MKNAISPHQKILDLLHGSLITKVLSLIGTLGIADFIDSNEVHVEIIAKNIDANESVIYRMLRSLAAIGVFEEVKPMMFKNNEYSNTFRTDSQNSLKDILIWYNSELYLNTVNKLDLCIESKESAFSTIFGEDLFSYFSKHPEDARIFNNAMTSFTQSSADSIINNYEFSKYENIVDIGGGLGTLIINILQKNSNSYGILFETKEVITEFKNINKELPPRLEIISGDFFKEIPKNNDLYIMKHISHDWDDNRLLILLNNIQKAMSKDSRLLIIDRVLSNKSSIFSQYLDIVMMAFSPEGKERTLDEFNELASKSNFHLLRVIETNEEEKIIEFKRISKS